MQEPLVVRRLKNWTRLRSCNARRCRRKGARDLRQLCDGIDVSYALPYVRAPTLVVHSRHDNAVPLSEGRRLAQCIPNARFVVLESANHLPLPQDSAWPLFISEVQQFLGG